MSNWQAELELLLASLHVTMDSGVAIQPSRAKGEIEEEPHLLDDFEPSLISEGSNDQEIVPAAGDEVAAVRNEIEVTVRRVVAMTEAGLLEASVRDDVLFVLQALTRPQPPRPQPPRPLSPADSSGEWQLTSAAAVLHFCRIVLRLTQAIKSNDA